MPRTFQTTHVYSSLILLFNGYKVTYPGVKRPEREVNHPPSSSVAVENEWRCSLFPIYSLVAWTKKVFLILVPRLDMRGAWCFLELALLPHRTCCTRPWCRWWLNYVQSFIKYVPCLLYRLLYRLTNAQHTQAGLAGTRTQSGDRYGSGTLHPGQVLRGRLPLLSPAFRRSHLLR